MSQMMNFELQSLKNSKSGIGWNLETKITRIHPKHQNSPK